MSRIMLIIGSVRPGRIGKPIAEWAIAELASRRVDLDVVDLVELALPFMDEPAHPRLRQYTHQHTFDWSERVDAADGFVFVTPEYNHSFSPALKNALDFVSHEWNGKHVGFVSYGGISAGSRGVVALEPALVPLGLQRTRANVELAWAAQQVSDGDFAATDSQQGALVSTVDEIVGHADTFAAAR